MRNQELENPILLFFDMRISIHIIYCKYGHICLLE
jgi:hypothetical protein